MKTQSHSPGPWTVENHWLSDSTGLVTIATFPTVEYSQSPEVKNGELVNPANAALIAAAPDLLEACKAAVSALWQHFEYHHDGDDDCGAEHCQNALDQLRNAIAKAGVVL